MRETAVCGKCRRVLKNPKSAERGFGPVCWASVQASQRENKALQTADQNDSKGAEQHQGEGETA